MIYSKIIRFLCHIFVYEFRTDPMLEWMNHNLADRDCISMIREEVLFHSEIDSGRNRKKFPKDMPPSSKRKTTHTHPPTQNAQKLLAQRCRYEQFCPKSALGEQFWTFFFWMSNFCKCTQKCGGGVFTGDRGQFSLPSSLGSKKYSKLVCLATASDNF